MLGENEALEVVVQQSEEDGMEPSGVPPVRLGFVIYLWLHAEQTTMHDSYLLNHSLLCVWLSSLLHPSSLQVSGKISSAISCFCS